MVWESVRVSRPFRGIRLTRVLIIGGYGHFGRYISKGLANHQGIELVIAGRNLSKAQELAKELNAEAAKIDIHDQFLDRLQSIRPSIVIHTSGPFQSQAYGVAEACIEYGAHYIDLADGREFVSNINKLDHKAKQAKVSVISGASSVPCLTSALIEHYKSEFDVLEALDYGITTAQKTAPGLATTAAILSYTGKPFTTRIDGQQKTVFGWQGLRAKKYSDIGWRLLGNCNIPDLDLFPTLYPELKTIRFYAGLELSFIHFSLWMLSWFVRFRLISSLKPFAPLLLNMSSRFNKLGSASSAFHMSLSGKDSNSVNKTIRFELIAKNGDGAKIPCVPAILLAKKLASGELNCVGAKPCAGMISKKEYLDALSVLDISWSES